MKFRRGLDEKWRFWSEKGIFFRRRDQCCRTVKSRYVNGVKNNSFANAQGGKIFIGVDDKGHVVGLQNAKKLMEDIPNKIRDALGLFVDVNLLSVNFKEYIEISVVPSTYPVNYKGEYHYRTGSTKQLLQGTALTQFLLNKTGTKWDAIPVDCVDFRDLDKESFGIFRREAKKSGRMTAQDLSMTDEELLDSLNLVVDGKLTRAAILLFHRRPERWFGGAFVKVGFFGDGPDLQYQDEIYGSLFIQADRVVELIYLKYFKARISYDGLIRVERYPDTQGRHARSSLQCPDAFKLLVRCSDSNSHT